MERLARLASVEGSGLVTLASADEMVDDTVGMVSDDSEGGGAAAATPPARPLLPEMDEDGALKSNLGNDENAILLGRTVGRLALFSEDLKVTGRAGGGALLLPLLLPLGATTTPGLDVSMGTVCSCCCDDAAPLDLVSMILILSGRLVPPPELRGGGAASPVNRIGGSCVVAKHGVKLNWSSDVVGICGKGSSPSCGPVGFSGVPA